MNVLNYFWFIHLRNTNTTLQNVPGVLLRYLCAQLLRIHFYVTAVQVPKIFFFRALSHRTSQVPEPAGHARPVSQQKAPF